jgi:hypothetical protein
MPPPGPPWRVDRADLLWRTRGRRWDYEFISRPSRPWADESYAVTRALFTGSAGVAPTNLAGRIEGEPFLACSVLDPERLDEFDRPIQHYLVWLAPPEAFGDGRPRVAADWALRIIGEAREVLSDFHERASAPHDPAWDVSTRLEPTDAPGPWRSVPEIRLPKAGRPPRRPPRRGGRMGWAAALLVLLLLAVLAWRLR